ncbi:MAG: Omp28-related outer membrane protein [Bacteroidales bacterium]|nr:Omp28-related outer membrane protein [Bacteroidales bacterium]
MTLSIHRFSSAFLLLAFAFACTPILPDLTFPETGSSGSASVEVNWSSETSVGLVFPSSGGSATVAIKATGNWEASISGAPVDWCTFSPSSGASVDTQFKVNVSANDSYMDRNCSITLVCGENRRTVVVTQKQKDAILVTPAKVEIPAEGSTLEVEVRHNTEFSYAVSKSATEWIVPVETRGMTTDKIRFEVRMNPDSEPRQGDISFMSGAVGETVHVYQEGLAPCIILTQKEFSVGADGGTVTVELKSNVDFECKVTEGSSWLKETSTRSTLSTHTRSFTVAANPDEKPRTGRIVFSNPSSGLSETVTVVQDRLVAFSLSPNHVELEADGGEFEVAVTSTIGYKVTSMPEWIKEVSTRATTSAHTFLASANRVEEPRSGVIVFCNDENVCIPVTVAQKQRNDAIDWNKEFYHRSLFMRFTATWCPACPIMYGTVLLAQERYPDKLIHVALHGYDSELYFPPMYKLDSQYHVTGYPTGIVDGRTEIRNEGEEIAAPKTIAAAKETESLLKTKTGVSVLSHVSGREVHIDLTVYAKKSGKYKLTVLILEDGIIASQSGASTLMFTHNDVARIEVSDLSGDSFSISKDNSFKDFSYTVTIPEKYDMAKMKTLVYVQAEFSSQNRYQSNNYGNYYVDNCLTVPLGESLKVPMLGSASGSNNEGIIPGKDIEL